LNILRFSESSAASDHCTRGSGRQCSVY